MITSWFADLPGPAYAPRVLTNISLDLAVAQGAAYYGVVRRGEGIRIGGGTARSFYVGLETSAAEKPWLCVVPRDSQEGEEITIAGHDFDLLMGQPVVFPLASSSVRADDKPGDLVRADPDSIRELPPLQSLMRVSRKAKAERAPVSLAARVTEVGTIELWCQSRTDARRWRLQIQLRGPAGHLIPRGSVTGDESDHVVIEQSELDAATAAIRAAFDDRPAGATMVPVAATEHAGPARLVKRLEEVLDVPREEWPPSALRALWDPLARIGREKAEEPAARVALVQPGGLLSAPGARFPARRRADQGPLADLSSGREAHQGRAVLGRVVDPLAARRCRAGATASRGNPSAAGSVPAAGQGIEPRQESRPAQARSPRDRRDVAMCREPRASGP